MTPPTPDPQGGSEIEQRCSLCEQKHVKSKSCAGSDPIEEAAREIARVLFKLNWLNQARIGRITKAGECVLDRVARDLMTADIFGPPALPLLWEDGKKAGAEHRATEIKEVRGDNERLAGLLKTTRDADLVDMTADRDSWHQQSEMHAETVLMLGKEVDDLKAQVERLERWACPKCDPEYKPCPTLCVAHREK